MNIETTKLESTNGKSATAPTTMLNGIDTAAFLAAGEALTANPALAAIGFRVATTWRGGCASSAEVREYRLAGTSLPHRHRIEADEPCEMLGADTAPNPQDLLLAALNACMTVGFVAGATKRGIRLDALTIESALDFDLRGAFGLDPQVPAGAQTIRYTVRVRSSGTRAEMEEILKDVMATSPNVHHLSKPIDLSASLIVE
jgi:uncharacterized OsmC-like protein